MQTQAATTPTDPTQVMGRRILAFVIDLLIGAAIGVTLFIANADSSTLPSAVDAAEVCDFIQNSGEGGFCVNVGADLWVTDSDTTNMIGLVLFLYGVFFIMLLPGVSGWSIGKLVTGLRVVKHDTRQLAGMAPNVIRWVLWIIDWIPYFLPLVGLLTGLLSKKHQRIGDLAAGTLVIDKAAVGVLAESTAPVAAASDWSAAAMAAPTAPPVSTSAAPPTPPSSSTFPDPTPGTAHVPPSFPPPDSPPVTSALTPFTPPAEADATSTMPAIEEPAAPASQPAPEDGDAAARPPVQAESPDAPPESAPVTPSDAEQAEPGTPTRPGVDAPQWDEARGTYIQWDPELGQWMEWSETAGRWIPIST